MLNLPSLHARRGAAALRYGLLGCCMLLVGCTPLATEPAMTAQPLTSTAAPSSEAPPPAPENALPPAEIAPPPAEAPPADAQYPGPAADLIAAAREALPLLEVKGRAPKTGYSRAEFGQAWSDDVSVPGGHNGCDTRNDILARDLVVHEYKPSSPNCVVLRGTLIDPYSGEHIEFVRGRNTSAAVQIDHVVALSDAWQKGAQQLSPERRRDFANDPLNLQATSGPLNQQKRDGDAATWQPPNKAYRCEYAARQIVVKSTYNLWVTEAEKAALERELGRCPA